MKLDKNMSVGDVAAVWPEAMAVFQGLGIDFCCGGKQALYEALGQKDVSAARFEALLEAALNARESRRQEPQADFTKMSPAVLSAYIEDTHHDYLRRALPEIAGLLHAVLRAHGENHRELFELYRLFGTLKADLEQHLIKEETLLFPALAEEGALPIAIAAEIMAEHGAAGEILRKIRSLANDFEPPADACNSYRRLYTLLPELEADLHRHIHLENNILLKGMAA